MSIAVSCCRVAEQLKRSPGAFKSRSLSLTLTPANKRNWSDLEGVRPAAI